MWLLMKYAEIEMSKAIETIVQDLRVRLYHQFRWMHARKSIGGILSTGKANSAQPWIIEQQINGWTRFAGIGKRLMLRTTVPDTYSSKIIFLASTPHQQESCKRGKSLRTTISLRAGIRLGLLPRLKDLSEPCTTNPQR
jgi:hypothetical protein